MKKAVAGIKNLPIYNHRYKYSLVFLSLMLVFIIGAYPIFNIKSEVTKSKLEQQIFYECKLNYENLMKDLEETTAKFSGEAGVLIKDLKTHNSIGINTLKLFPSASLVKLPIMAAVFQAEKEGIINLSDKVVLRRKHKVRGSGKLYYARCGRKYSIYELVKQMITQSDNTATNVLVDTLGFGYINKKFVEFGLMDTDLRRGVMDLKWRRAGIENYTTAHDMCMMLERIYYKDLVSPDASAEMLNILKQQKVNDRIPRLLPRNLTIAHKTGLLRDTVSDVGIVFTNEGDFIICVLTSDIRSLRQAKRFIRRVAAHTYQECYSKS